MSDNTGPWGPYHDHIGEGLAHCVDYLGRLQRSLAGEIAPDRHYFTTKAQALRDASVGLLRRARDVERWLAEGDDHDSDGDGRTPAERLAARADALAAVATEVADTLAWATSDLDAGEGSLVVGEALGDTARRLERLRRAAEELAADVAGIADRHA
jgi:hypothetical protein